uniref:Uncharacterized protein n=1 Tax=Solanum tuberosum TaxID=4113 RepID=M1AZY3_SOLTU
MKRELWPLSGSAATTALKLKLFKSNFSDFQPFGMLSLLLIFIIWDFKSRTSIFQPFGGCCYCCKLDLLKSKNSHF